MQVCIVVGTIVAIKTIGIKPPKNVVARNFEWGRNAEGVKGWVWSRVGSGERLLPRKKIRISSLKRPQITAFTCL